MMCMMVFKAKKLSALSLSFKFSSKYECGCGCVCMCVGVCWCVLVCEFSTRTFIVYSHIEYTVAVVYFVFNAPLSFFLSFQEISKYFRAL